MSHGRTYDEQRFSPLDQINETTSRNWALAWFVDLDTNRGQEATPIVVDGVLYVSTAWSKVKAYDATTGETLWEYDPQVPARWAVNACCDVVNRGVAVWEGKVFVGTIDGRLSRSMPPPASRLGRQHHRSDEAVHDHRRAARGQRQRAHRQRRRRARRARLCLRLRRRHGRARLALLHRARQSGQRLREPDPREGRRRPGTASGGRLGGGGTVWDSMAYDPELDLLYIGVGNGSPWNHTIRSQGNGDNLFLASIVALDPDDGSYVWHYQTTPGDTWDYTATQQIVARRSRRSTARSARCVMQAPKNGFFYVLDAKTGELISAKNFTDVSWATHIDLQTGRPWRTPTARYNVTGKFFASLQNPNGAHTWHSMSLQPADRARLHSDPLQLRVWPRRALQAQAMGTNLGVDFSGNAPASRSAETRCAALRPADRVGSVAQKEVWRVERAGPANGGALSTAGGLVFQGTGMGEFTALDAGTATSAVVVPSPDRRAGRADFL